MKDITEELANKIAQNRMKDITEELANKIAEEKKIEIVKNSFNENVILDWLLA